MEERVSKVPIGFDEQLKQMMALCDTATPGPWYATAHECGGVGRVWTVGPEPDRENWETDCAQEGYGMKKADAEFAAAARENVPILVRLCLNLDHEVVTLQGELSVLKHKLKKEEDENEALKTVVLGFVEDKQP